MPSLRRLSAAFPSSSSSLLPSVICRPLPPPSSSSLYLSRSLFDCCLFLFHVVIIIIIRRRHRHPPPSPMHCLIVVYFFAVVVGVVVHRPRQCPSSVVHRRVTPPLPSALLWSSRIHALAVESPPPVVASSAPRGRAASRRCHNLIVVF